MGNKEKIAIYVVFSWMIIVSWQPKNCRGDEFVVTKCVVKSLRPANYFKAGVNNKTKDYPCITFMLWNKVPGLELQRSVIYYCQQVKKDEKIITVLLIAAVVVSCKKEDKEKQLPVALQQIINSSGNCVCEPYINLFTWRNQQVYLLGATGPACNWTPAYYNEKGEVITMSAGYTLDMFIVESQLIRVVWRCGDEASRG